MDKGLLLVLSGPSGVGKGTVRKVLMKDPTLNLYFSISMTTRSPRNGETDGVEYYFVSKEEFRRNVISNNLLEWTEFVGNCYGTPRDKVDAMRNEGKNVLLEIEVNGQRSVVSKCPDAITIFLVPPSIEDLEKRIRGRASETDEVIKERLEKARKEMKLADSYKYVVVNDNVESAAKAITEIIKKELAK